MKGPRIAWAVLLATVIGTVQAQAAAVPGDDVLRIKAELRDSPTGALLARVIDFKRDPDAAHGLHN